MDLVILLPYARSVIPSKKGAGIDAYDSEIIDKKLSVALLDSVQAKKRSSYEAHRATFSGQGDLYDLGKLRVPISREFCQASCGIEGF